MPVRQLKRNAPDPAEEILLGKLVAEWKARDSGAAQPVILEERPAPLQPSHVYVVWDEWQPLDRARRSEIIMDAFELVHGLDEAVKVTVAMGLTPAEADRMGISWRA